MSRRPYENGDAPPPEWLAGYADGELDARARAAVEAWLAGRPDAAAEVEGQRRVRQLYRDAAPAEPNAAAWDAVWARVGDALPPRRPAPRPRWPWLAAVALASAAAVAVSARLAWPTASLNLVPAWTPYPVVSADDVEVLSMDAADVDALVVGAPPVRGPIVLVSAEDISLEDMGPDEQGRLPDVRMPEGSGVPMAMPPLGGKEP